MGGGFSSVLLVDSYVSRRFPMFHLKNRRTFALFTSNLALRGKPVALSGKPGLSALLAASSANASVCRTSWAACENRPPRRYNDRAGPAQWRSPTWLCAIGTDCHLPRTGAIAYPTRRRYFALHERDACLAHGPLSGVYSGVCRPCSPNSSWFAQAVSECASDGCSWH